MSSVPQQVRAHLVGEGAIPTPGATDEQIAAFEARHSLTLPPTVANFYRSFNGATMAPWITEFWPIDEVGPVPIVVTPFQGIPNYARIAHVLPDAADYFAFGDCMIWSHVLAVRLRPVGAETNVVWMCGSVYAHVAKDFDEFWTLYMNDPDVVLWARDAEEIGA